MSLIHPTAVISSEADIGTNVEIGPFAVVGAASVGNDCVLHPHVTILDDVELGCGVEVYPGAVVGKAPSTTGVNARKVQSGGAVRIGRK